MAVTKHKAIKNPEDWSARVWRYMDFTKYLSMLVHESVYFCRADKLGDPFEGSRPIQNVRDRIKLKDIDSEFFKDQVKQTFVSCWHMSDHESAAMWKLYTRTNESVAVESTYSSLSFALPDLVELPFKGAFFEGPNRQPIFMGQVQYIDYENSRIDGDVTLGAYLHKRKSFEHEKEVRAIIHLGAEEAPREIGLHVGVDISSLVHSVHIAPGAPKWFRDLVARTTAQFGYGFSIISSSLDSEPDW
jgi:hypothetical protein